MDIDGIGELKKLFDRYPQSTLDRFKKFHSENPHVYKKFKDLAFQMKNTGRSRYSAETIVNVIRWHEDLQSTGNVFKINDHFRSIYARLLIYHHPEFIDFFELRQNAPNRGLLSEEEQNRLQGIATSSSAHILQDKRSIPQDSTDRGA
jgi:hypothetical protein